MARLCPRDGSEIPAGTLPCPACGWRDTIQLTGSADSMRSKTTIDIRQDPLTRRICGDDARFMDTTRQFTIRRGDEDWFLCPNLAIKNETFVNGTAVAGDTVLSDGDEISLKGKAAFIKVSFP